MAFGGIQVASGHTLWHPCDSWWHLMAPWCHLVSPRVTLVALRCTEWLPSVTWCSSVSLLCHLNVTWWHLVTLRYQLVAPWWHVVARSITSCHPNVTLVAINVTPVSLWWPLMSPQCHLGGTQWHPKDTPRSHGGIWWHLMAPTCHLLSPQCHFSGT